MAVDQHSLRDVSVAADARDSAPLHIALLLAAVAGALLSQGAYYRAAQWPVAVLLAGALVVAVRAHPWSVADSRFAPLMVCAALAGWAMVRAATAGHVGDGMGVVALLAGVGATVVVARRTTDVDAVGAGIVALGVLTAMTGWVGLAWRISPWALLDGGLWRAATTLTYANAAAGVLAAVTLAAVGRLVARADSYVTALSVCLLLTGLGATLSRGGMLAFGVGGLVLAGLLGVRSVARAVLPPGIGAAVALAGLVPSMSAGSPRNPLLASAALMAGLGVTSWLVSGGRGRRGAVLVATVLIVLGVGVAAGDGWDSATAVRERRFTAASPDRTNAVRAAFGLVGQHPIVGVGPGRATLSWTSQDGTTLVARYAHNEYLQLLVELGAVGLVLLLGLMFAVARAVLNARQRHPSGPLWAGATAGLLALAVGSGVDFLWHVPAVPLVGALLFGITVPNAKEKNQL
jgi:hypothetical protein